MRIASLAEVKAKLSAYLQEIETTGPVVITRNGKAVAILLAPIDDDDLERLLLSRSPRFRSVLSESRASLCAGKGITHASFWKASATRNPGASEVRERPARARAAQQGVPAAVGRRKPKGNPMR
ncbi:MAG: type II toxin-antitoxin system Phd/YefM family antitoxin [Candidatus Eisenbacteria bacterium]|uniref:Antitoxin n=1 Tax=Eiseniibacteriota bacterium TaxID=2212470 RepID=A0A938BQB1_UNCEI|nr:type II toxin-antitoxin system Phd/YefM family antitoxin [Candidatus Eisenbacteria bacterium]